MAEERSPRGSVRTDIYLSIFLRKRVLLLLPPHDATRLILLSQRAAKPRQPQPRQPQPRQQPEPEPDAAAAAAGGGALTWCVRAWVSGGRRGAMSDDLGSEAESAPPAPNGHAVPVAAVAGPQHPVWQRAAGGPPPPHTKHTATTRPGTTTVNGRFVPISMVALELRARNEFDGASSVGSEPRHARERQQQHSGNKKRARPRGGDADDSEEEEAARDDGTSSRMRDECDDFDPLDDDANDEVHDDGSEAASGADVVANAAFGGGQKKKAKRRSGATTTALSVASDTESVSSSQRRNAHCRAFPVPGVECVGCALPAKVTPVDDFVRSSCDKMQESALFKMAALVYQQKVAEPALAEGVHVPAWAYVGAPRTHLTAPRRPRPHPPLAARA